MTYQVKPMLIGVNGFPVQVLLINTDNTIAEVLTTGYLGPEFNFSDVKFSNKQIAMVYTTDGGMATYAVSVDSNGVASLEPGDDNPGTVHVHGAPVTPGQFAFFYNARGDIEDLDIYPSDAHQSVVPMFESTNPSVAGQIPKFLDTAGTVTASSGAVFAKGSITAGASGVAGSLKSNSGTGTSYLALTAAANASNNGVIIQNASHAQTTTYSISDVGATTGALLNCALAAADPASDLIAFDVTVGFAVLAAAGSVTLYTGSGSKQYKIRELWVNRGGTNFSGGGGDRLLSITDNTTVYSLVPAASLQTLANTGWGSTGVPFPASAAINTSTAAGASLVAKYSGGAADYTAGSVVISGVLQRVA